MLRRTGPCSMPTAVGSALAPQKVMHTRKRHSELYHELNQKFHTLDRYRAPAAGSSKVRSWGSHSAPVCSLASLHPCPCMDWVIPRRMGAMGHPWEDAGSERWGFFHSEKSGGVSRRAAGRRVRPT